MADAIDLKAAQARLDERREALGIRRPTHTPRIGSACVSSALSSLPEQPPAEAKHEPSPVAISRAFWSRAARLEGLMLAAGAMLEHADASQADFPAEVTEALRAVWDRPGVLITGQVGRGKTHLAAALVRRHVLGGATVRMLVARELFMAIRDTYRENAERTELQVLRELTELDCLVVDDLAREGAMTPQVLSVLHLVLSKRIGNRKRTIVTTNLSLAQIEQHYDAAIASRLGTFGVVVLDGADRRRT